MEEMEAMGAPMAKGGFGTLPTPLIVLCGGFPQNFVSDLESAHLSDTTHSEVALEKAFITPQDRET